jgi:hypothetical protein
MREVTFSLEDAPCAPGISLGTSFTRPIKDLNPALSGVRVVEMLALRATVLLRALISVRMVSNFW